MQRFVADGTLACSCGLARPHGRPCRILASHGAAALAPPPRADMGFAFALLLGGFTAALLALGAGEIALVLLLALILRGARFMQSNRDRLTTVLHLAALTATSSLQFTMLVLVHD